MTPEFVQFITPDKLTLPGLLFQPPRAHAVMIHLHGNGSSSVFYEQNYDFAQTLYKNGVALLMFNNRGAHLVKKINVEKNGEVERKLFGMAYEKIKECVEDIDGAVSFLEKKGFKTFYLAGESTGANKICVYNYYKSNNKIAKYILIAGGDDTGIYYDMLGKDKFNKLLKKSQEKIKNKKGEEMIAELLPDEFFSYQGFYDITNPDGDYNVFPFYEVINKVKLSTKPFFRHYKSINKPTLVVYGEKDEYAWGNVQRVVDILKKQQPKFEYKIIPDADHGFHGKEKDLAQTIVTWLKK